MNRSYFHFIPLEEHRLCIFRDNFTDQSHERKKLTCLRLSNMYLKKAVISKAYPQIRCNCVVFWRLNLVFAPPVSEPFHFASHFRAIREIHRL